MVKKGIKKDVFYVKESDWWYVIVVFVDVVDYWCWSGVVLV